MKLTALTIAPQRSYSPPSEKNPLRAVVKLDSDNTSVEVVLSDDAMRRMLALVADEIAAAAKANVAEFVAAVSAIDADKAGALIGAE